MQWLNYHHLYYFWMIANEGGIAKASEKLLLGQPTLSTQLKQLEEALGRPLFERKNRKLYLTESGQIALDYANEIFKLGAEMVEVLQDRMPAQAKTHIQIGALDSVPKHLTLRLTQAAYETGPCLVSILEGKGDELLRELIAHRIDILLSNYPPSLGMGSGEEVKVHARSIAKVPIVICGAPRFKSLARKFPQSLSGQPFVLPTYHSKLRHDLDHFFRVQQIQISPVAETQDTSLQKLLGTSGVGLIPIAEPAAEDLIRDKSLIRIGRLEGVFEEFWLMSASRKNENPIAARMMRSFQI
jgi:LysR family transcriptional activator of nhaA